MTTSKVFRKMEFYSVGKEKWLIDLPDYGFARLVHSDDLELEFGRLQRIQPVFLKTDIYWQDGTPYLEVDDEGELFSFFIRSRRNALDLNVDACASLIGISSTKYLAIENDLTLMTMKEFKNIQHKMNPHKARQKKEVLLS